MEMRVSTFLSMSVQYSDVTPRGLIRKNTVSISVCDQFQSDMVDVNVTQRVWSALTIL